MYVPQDALIIRKRAAKTPDTARHCAFFSSDFEVSERFVREWGAPRERGRLRCASGAASELLGGDGDDGGVGRACVFAFVREPLGRFASAYNEVEWRLATVRSAGAEERVAAFSDEQRERWERRHALAGALSAREGAGLALARVGGGTRWASAPLGTTERFDAFMEMLLRLEWLGDGDDSGDSGAMGRARRVLGHLSLQTGALLEAGWDVAPRVEAGVTAGLDAVARACGGRVGAPNTTLLRPHVTSDDPLGTYRASKRALGLPVDVGSVDEAPGPMSRARRAACLLSANDIVLLGYAPPAQCEDDLRRLEARRRAEQLFGG